MNIILIGMRGSGKTTVGGLLARKLNFNCVETDNLIISKSGFSKIADIVAQKGWKYFRDLESQILQSPEIAQSNDAVVATGGGVVTDDKNMQNLKKGKNIFVWLKCPIDKIIARIGRDGSRPFLTDEKKFADDLRKVYKHRESLYAKYADIAVSSDNDAQETANNIIDALKERALI